MKPSTRQMILVYSSTVLTLVGLVFLANVYAKTAQDQIQEQRDSDSSSESAKRVGKRVKVIQVFHQPLEDILVLPGTVEAYEDIELASKRAGTVEWMGPKEGDRVNSGDKLIQLDVKVLEAQVNKVRAEFQLVRMKHDRTEELFSRQVVTHEEYDEIEGRMKTAQAILEEFEAQLAEGTLYAPIDGILDRRYVDRGEHVREGQPVMKVVDIGRVKIVFEVPEKDIAFFKAGEKVNVRLSDSGEEVLLGTIEYVATTASLPARTFPLKVVVDNPEAVLRPGMIVRGELVRRHMDQGIAVPFYSLVERENGKSLFVVEGDQAQERTIQHGMFQRGMVEITEGLNEGDTLVVVGQRDLVQGQTVTIAADLTDQAEELVQQGQDLTELIMN